LQQPPPAQVLASQHAWLAAPQATQVFVTGLHAIPLAVQKFSTNPNPFAPVQHASPKPPQKPAAAV
jgi:hypothetical protein